MSVTSYLDTHRRADLLWALALFALGLGLALNAKVLYFRLDPADRQPITPDSKRSAVIRLLLGTGVSVLGILGLCAGMATGHGVGYVLVGVAYHRAGNLDAVGRVARVPARAGRRQLNGQ